MTAGNLRVALFPCTYREIDGVANTSRQFAAFAQQRGFPFLLAHAGPCDEVNVDGSFIKVQMRRGPLTFPLDGHHKFDLLFLRHYFRLARLLRDFRPDFIHITGPSDVGILGALLSHNLNIPLGASWQTNLHQFARCRVSGLLSSWPAKWSAKVAAAAESASFRTAAYFYKRMPRLLFTPNCEMVEILEKATGRPCYLMSHSVNTTDFSPSFRNRCGGPFQIGYVGRLTAEKNVRFLARLERELLATGNRDFRFILIGKGAEEKWLRENMKQADFVGWLGGEDLSRAVANLDAFVFPSETDTFGLAVLEALASGVPAVVASSGGPKYTVEHGKSGYVANTFDEFAPRLAALMTRHDLHDSMGTEARRRAVNMGSWDQIFAGMYHAYERYAHPATEVESILLEEAGKVVNT